MIKGIIFDLDGVLTDTSIYHFKAWRRLACEKFNFEFTKMHNEAFLGVSRKECMRLLEGKMGITLAEDIRTEFLTIKNGYYLEYLNGLTPSNLNEGTTELLDECRRFGLKLAVASASKNTRTVLKKTRIIECFDVIVDGNSVTKTKPDPECFLLAANELGLKPSECIVVEDAQAGIDGANAGGFYSVGIGTKPLINADVQYSEISKMDITDILETVLYKAQKRKENYCGSKY